MSDSVEEQPVAASAVIDFLERFNLPHLLAGPAGKAISRLIGAATDIPAAKLEQYAQGIKDKTAAKSALAKALANAAAKRASDNPALIDRATEALLNKELRRQANKEKIAEKVIDQLDLEATSEPTATDVDDDWLNVFERYAEDASTERLQEIWSRVLAGQIRKPGSFSLNTLRFIAELDESIANAFERLAPKIAFGEFAPISTSSLEGQFLTDLLLLEEYGLTYNFSASIERTILFHDGIAVITLGTHGLLLKRVTDSSLPHQFTLSGVFLTRVGSQVYRILQPEFDRSFADELSRRIPRNLVREISICKIEYLPDSIRWIETRDVLIREE